MHASSLVEAVLEHWRISALAAIKPLQRISKNVNLPPKETLVECLKRKPQNIKYYLTL